LVAVETETQTETFWVTSEEKGRMATKQQAIVHHLNDIVGGSTGYLGNAFWGRIQDT
jgi:hypothetical protein